MEKAQPSCLVHEKIGYEIVKYRRTDVIVNRARADQRSAIHSPFRILLLLCSLWSDQPQLQTRLLQEQRNVKDHHQRPSLLIQGCC